MTTKDPISFLLSHIKVLPIVKNYAWGKKGLESLVATLYHGNSIENIQHDEPYAELWFGVHNDGMCVVLDDKSQSLDDRIRKNKNQFFFNNNVSSFDPVGFAIPFLFKVLSVDQPLSLQLHPSAVYAQQLHAQYPHIYRDANPKPEIAIAVSQFELLCGFRPLSSVKQSLNEVHILKHLIDLHRNTNCDNHLKDQVSLYERVVRSILHYTDLDTNSKIKDSEDTDIQNELRLLYKYARSVILEKYKSDFPETTSDEEDSPRGINYDKSMKEKYNVFIKLYECQPGDIGCLFAFILNYYSLQPGQAIFIPPNTIHCYIQGNCVECMTNSTNVIRCGLTTKRKDAQLLCHILDYTEYDQQFYKLFPVIWGHLSKAESILSRDDKFRQVGLVYVPPPRVTKDYILYRIEMDDCDEYDSLNMDVPANCIKFVIAVSGFGRMYVSEDDKFLNLFPGSSYVLHHKINSITVERTDNCLRVCSTDSKDDSRDSDAVGGKDCSKATENNDENEAKLLVFIVTSGL